MNLPSFQGLRLSCHPIIICVRPAVAQRARPFKLTEVAKILVLGKDAVTAEKNLLPNKLLENAATAQPTGDSIREIIENERTGTVSKNPDLTETLTKDKK